MSKTEEVREDELDRRNLNGRVRQEESARTYVYKESVQISLAGIIKNPKCREGGTELFSVVLAKQTPDIQNTLCCVVSFCVGDFS